MRSFLARGVIILLLARGFASGAANKAALSKADFDGGTADTTTIRLVQYFMETETGELAPETVPHFMEVDPATLPPKLRGPYMAKKQELLALQKVAAGKKKPPLRRIGNEEEPKCETEKGSPQQLAVMKQAGFQIVEENEVLLLMQKTSCSECELETEFTLHAFLMPIPKDAKKGDKPKKIYMLYESDPLWALVAAQRAGSSGGTNFFGTGAYPKCR